MRYPRPRYVGASHEVRTAVAAHPLVLSLCFGARPDLVAPSDAEWESAAQTLVAHRLSPIVLGLPSEVSRRMPTHVADLLRAATFDQVSQSENLLCMAAPVLGRLIDRGVELVMIKGPAVARFHTRPRDRTFADLDILVGPSCFARARRILESEGLRMRVEASQPWNWFDRCCREGVNLVGEPAGAVDLHHHLPPWCFSRAMAFDSLRARAETIRLGSVDVPAASAPDSAMVAALAACNDLYKGDPGLIAWWDFAAIRNALGDRYLQDFFTEAGLGWLYGLGLTVLAALAGRDGGDSPTPVPPAAERRLRALGWDGSTALARHPVGWAARLPIARALAFLVGSAIPSPAYARDKHGGYLAYWSESIDTLAAAARGTDFRSEDLHAGKRRHASGILGAPRRPGVDGSK